MARPLHALIIDTVLAGRPPESDAAWTTVIREGGRQGLLGFLWRELQVAGRSVPAALNDEVTLAVRQAALRVLVQRAAYHQLCTPLHAAGIPCVALKGLHLASAVYAVSGDRTMTDLDVLVPRAALEQVQEVAQTLGYIRRTATPPGIREDLALQHHLPAMVRGDITLEIHYGLIPPAVPGQVRPMALEDSLARATPVPGLPRGLGLCPEDLLVHLCAHGANQHLFERGLRALWDVHMVLERMGSTLVWPRVLSRAEEWGVTRGLALTLRLCRDLVEVPVPPACNALVNSVPAAMVGAALSSLSARPGVPHVGQALARLWDPSMSVSARLRFAWSRAFRSGVAQPWLMLADYATQVRGLSRESRRELSDVTRARAALSGWLNPIDGT